MKPHVSIAVAVLLVAVSAISGHAEDSAAQAPSQPAAAQPEAPPPSVPRPSIGSKPAEPPAPPVADTAPESRVSHRHYRRYVYHARYFGPFPIYWPEFGRNRVYWHRIPWPFRFDRLC
jgi:hypothetical protein